MKSKKVSRDIPIAELTLRKYGRPHNLEKRELIKRICLSIGLLQPGDSRDVITDVLQVMIDTKKAIDCEEVVRLVKKNRTKYKLKQLGVAASNIRRQLKRLRDIFMVEKVANNYRIAEGETLTNLYNDKIKQFYLQSIVERVGEYFEALEK